jgi:hypothetical protein
MKQNNAKKRMLKISHGSSSGTRHLQVISRAQAEKLGIPTYSETIISQKLKAGSKTSYGQPNG